MKDERKTKKQLIDELEEARRRLADVEQLESGSEPFESQSRFRALMQSTTDMVIVTDTAGNILEANDKAANIAGYEREEIAGKYALDLIAPEYREEASRSMRRVIEEGATAYHELEFITKNGNRLTGEFSTNAIRDGSGKPTGMITIARDVTQRKQTERALLQQEERYRHLIEEINGAIYRMSIPDGTYEYFSQACFKVFGYSPFDFLQKPMFIRDIVHPDFADYLEKQWHEQLKGNVSPVYEYKIIDPEGNERWILQSNRGFSDDNGNITAIEGICIDITESKRNEEQLRNLYLAFEQSMEGIALSDMEGNLLFVNNSFASMHGFTSDELAGKHLAVFHNEEQVPAVEEANHQIKEQGKFSGEIWHTRTDGSVFPSLMNNSVILNESGKALGMIATMRDISELREAEQALRESEEKYRNLVERSSDLIVIIQDGLIRFANQRALDLMGYSPEETIGTPMTNYIAPDDIDMLIQRYQRRIGGEAVPSRYEARLVHRNGKIMTVEISGGTINYQGKAADMVIIHDVTERAQAEQQLRNSEEKLRTIFENVTDEIAYLDEFGTILDVNDRVENIFGWKRDEVIGRNFMEIAFMGPEAMQAMIETFARAFDSGATEHKVAFEARHRNGGPIHVEARAKLIEVSGGEKRSLVVVRDVTEQKRAEEALRQSEEKYRNLVENISEVIYSTEEDGRMSYISPSVQKFAGYSPSELIGENFSRFIHPDDFPQAFESYQKVLRGEQTRGKYRILTKYGEWRWIRASNNPITKHGKKVGTYGVLTDITEREEAVQALRESEEKYRSLVENINDVIFTLDTEGNFTYLSPAIEQISGYHPDELTGENFSEFVHPDDLGTVTTSMERTITGLTEPVEFRVYNKSGEIRHVRTSSRVIKESGQIKGVTGVLTDLTEAKRAEDALRESERRFQAMFESMKDGVVLADLEGIIVEVNDAVLNIGGFEDRDAAIGLNGFDFIAEKDRARAVEDMMKAFKEGRSATIEYELRTNNGVSIDIEATANLIYDAAGKPIGFINVLRDVTERKQIEEERERLLREIQQKSSDLEQILYATSHDLRSPLLNIQGFSSELEISLEEIRGLLEGREDVADEVKTKLAEMMDEDIHDSLQYILTSTSKMDSLLGGLLQLSRLGRKPLEIEEIDMNALMEAITSIHKYRLTDGNITLEAGDLPPCRADRDQIDQVFSNLVDNAVKFLDPERPGLIRVSGERRDGEVVYCVEDNGVGMEPEYQGRIFEIFHQLDPDTSTGEGLGLTIVRRILDRHYGRIWLESEPGKGSRFFVALPE
ncbi:MAG: PAS domain S-box protein [Dehalococcoidia bacterium]